MGDLGPWDTDPPFILPEYWGGAQAVLDETTSLPLSQTGFGQNPGLEDSWVSVHRGPDEALYSEGDEAQALKY